MKKRIEHARLERELRKVGKKYKKEKPHFLGLKYPKLFVLVTMIFLSYYIFNLESVTSFLFRFNSYVYLGIFIAGILFSFGFSTPFAIGFFVLLMPDNIFLASVIGGIGSTLADILIFRTIKFSFSDEFDSLLKEKPVLKLQRMIDANVAVKIRQYLLYIFAGIILASPLPDEAGVALLAGTMKINEGVFAAICFVLKTLGIFAIFFFA